MFRLPRAGDSAFADHPWIRRNDRAIGIGHPTIMFNLAELRGNGYDPQQLGLERIGAHTSNVEIRVVADMKSRFDVDLYPRRVGPVHRCWDTPTFDRSIGADGDAIGLWSLWGRCLPWSGERVDDPGLRRRCRQDGARGVTQPVIVWPATE